MVDSCQTCSSCKQDLEQFCENGATLLQQSDKHLEGKQTYGGYSTSVVVDENLYYAFRKFRQSALHRYYVQELLHGHHYVIGT
jgi:D-arabinose 1-dehydrogenase-like Zn-dependent alcohol dehydrogenase